MNKISTIHLPSNGLLGVPTTIGVRALGGAELSTIYASLDDAAIDETIRAATTPSLDPDLLTSEDKVAIMHEIRRNTFGDTIKVPLRCPHCGQIHDYYIDYTDLKTEYLTEEILKPITLLNGDTITRKFPVKVDSDNIKSFITKHNISKRGDLFTVSQMLLIDKVNDKKLTLLELKNYLGNLTGADYGALVEHHTKGFGFNPVFVVPCESCDTLITGGVGLTADLFRVYTKPVPSIN